VLDVWSRRIAGWAIGEQMTADLVLVALNMALQQRKPDGVVHHSDQGAQYTRIAGTTRADVTAHSGRSRRQRLKGTTKHVQAAASPRTRERDIRVRAMKAPQP